MVKNSVKLNLRAHECHDHNEVQLIFQLSVHMTWSGIHESDIACKPFARVRHANVSHKNHSVGHREASFKLECRNLTLKSTERAFTIYGHIFIFSMMWQTLDLKHWSSVCLSSAVDSAHWSWMHSSRTRSHFSAVKLVVWVECMWLSYFLTGSFKLSYIASY